MLLEAAVDVRADRHVALGLDDAVLVEGDLDAGVERDIGLGVVRQGPDDSQWLVRLERPCPDLLPRRGLEAEAIDGAGP